MVLSFVISPPLGWPTDSLLQVAEAEPEIMLELVVQAVVSRLEKVQATRVRVECRETALD
jgi:hypothetical protein